MSAQSLTVRFVLVFLAFAAFVAFVGAQGSDGQNTGPYSMNYENTYNPYPGGYHPTQYATDKSVMSYETSGYSGSRIALGRRDAFQQASHTLSTLSSPGILTRDKILALKAAISKDVDAAIGAAQVEAQTGAEAKAKIPAVPGETLSLEAEVFGNGQGNSLVVPNLTYSNALWGTDIGYQEFFDHGVGQEVSVKYAIGPQRRHLSGALKDAAHQRHGGAGRAEQAFTMIDPVVFTNNAKGIRDVATAISNIVTDRSDNAFTTNLRQLQNDYISLLHYLSDLNYTRGGQETDLWNTGIDPVDAVIGQPVTITVTGAITRANVVKDINFITTPPKKVELQRQQDGLVPATIVGIRANAIDIKVPTVMGVGPFKAIITVQNSPSDPIQTIQTGDWLVVNPLARSLVDYATGLQLSIYAQGRYLNDVGLFAAQGVSVGQMVPIGTAGLTPSVFAQAVQFYPRNASSPYGSDGQYGVGVVLQDQANGLDKQYFPHIRHWRVKAGYTYFSKTFGKPLTIPDAHEFFLRYRFVGPNPVEITPYTGWGGPGHQQYYGLNVGVTFPVKWF